MPVLTFRDMLAIVYGPDLMMKSLTKAQALLLGIPHPLVSGWHIDYADVELDEEMQHKFLQACTKIKKRELGIKSDPAPPKPKPKKVPVKKVAQEPPKVQAPPKPPKKPKQRKPRYKPTSSNILLLDEILLRTTYRELLKHARKVDNYDFIVSRGFLDSQEWKTLRYVALAQSGSRCCCCGRSAHEENVRLNVDHIKPRRLFPELALSLDNLQVLCADCNWGKLNGSIIDHRPKD
jgi:5-methylcytosine-specific restriction endonuclease McrA